MPSAQRYYTDDDLTKALSLTHEKEPEKLNVIYCRVSSPKQKGHLKRQINAMESFCVANGFKIEAVIEEIGGGLNYKRPKFLQIIEMARYEVQRLIIAHKDRLCHFGFDFFENFLCASWWKDQRS